MNALLAAFPSSSRAATPVDLALGSDLYSADSAAHVFFPIDCMISLFVREHAPVELALVGNEGMVGVPLLLASGTPPRIYARVRGAGSALRMDAGRLRDEMRENTKVREVVLAYAHRLMAHSAQIAACNRYHPLPGRFARLLLMSRDRMGSDTLALTHAVLAEMLGVRRVAVTITAREQARAGLISYSRGTISVTDLCRLQALACECYLTLRRLYSAKSAPAARKRSPRA